ncbi:MAG TPA: alpha/beta hydrolase [Acidimicrobiia bacterium]|nr:alpha/beta hydrolase [Acidimicrobiia bacterium]
MRSTRSIALATLPAAAAIALWNGYRRVSKELGSHVAASPLIPGKVRSIPTSWGRLSYRIVPGSDPGPPLVLVHGWGRSADSVWWPLIANTQRTVVAIDLPGHGRSLLDQRFTFDLAADAVLAAVADSGVIRPVLVGHSMGGPVALTALRRVAQAGESDFAGFVAIATSSYWVRPRHQIMVAAAPYAMAQGSPLLMRAQRAETRRAPDQASRIAWEYAVRPPRRILEEAAAELRRFDARRWEDLSLPPAVWIVTLEDGIIDPADQTASARHLGIPTVDLPNDHPVVIQAPAALARIIEEASSVWSLNRPIRIRRRMLRPNGADQDA